MKNKITLVISMILGLFVFNACNEPYPESIELEKFMYISLSGAADNPIVKTVDLDKTSSFPLSVSYGGTTNYEQGEIVANIAADILLVDSFNIKNATNYLPLPTGAYSFDKTSVTIANGSRISDQIQVTIQPNKVNFAKEYLLPVTITSATEGKIPVSEEFKTVYYIIKGNVKTTPSVDKWTVLDASSVWQAAFPVENVWDNDRNSYWHTALTGMPQWFAIDMNDYMLIEGFTWVNRQDATALPKHVKFETSMNGTDWTEVLDVAEMPNKKEIQILELPEKVIAVYFRVTILSNWADAPYTFVAEVSPWAGEKPTGDYEWEKNTWEINEFKSQWDNANWALSNIFDGNKATLWHSDPFNASINGMPQWFVVDMKKSRPAIKGFLIWNRQDDHGLEPKHVVFSVSDDKTKWTTVLDLQEMSNDYTKELSYKTTNPTPGRYLKVEVLSNWAGGAWTYFAEITPY